MGKKNQKLTPEQIAFREQCSEHAHRTRAAKTRCDELAAKLMGKKSTSIEYLDELLMIEKILEEKLASISEVVEVEAPAAEVVEVEAPAAEVVEVEAPAAEVVEVEAPAAEVVEVEAPAAEVVEPTIAPIKLKVTEGMTKAERDEWWTNFAREYARQARAEWSK